MLETDWAILTLFLEQMQILEKARPAVYHYETGSNLRQNQHARSDKPNQLLDLGSLGIPTFGASSCALCALVGHVPGPTQNFLSSRELSGPDFHIYTSGETKR